MTIRRVAAFAGALFALVVPAHAEMREAVLVLAEAENAEYLGAAQEVLVDDPREFSPLLGVFEARFRILHVLSGRLDLERIDTRIMATNGGIVLPGSRLVLLLGPPESGRSEVIAWQYPRGLVCLSPEVIDWYHLEGFENGTLNREVICAEITSLVANSGLEAPQP